LRESDSNCSDVFLYYQGMPMVIGVDRYYKDVCVVIRVKGMWVFLRLFFVGLLHPNIYIRIGLHNTLYPYLYITIPLNNTTSIP